MIASLVRLSRLPVGSSASTIAGSPTSARAMATRWRSPPDSAPGRWPAPRCRARPTSSASPARRSRCRRGTPAYSSPSATFSQRRQPLDEVELLEHEADAPAAHRRQPAVAEAADVAGRRCARCRSSGAAARRRCSSASTCPSRTARRRRRTRRRCTVEVDAVEGPHGRRAGVLLGDVDELEDRRLVVDRSTSSRPSRHHHLVAGVDVAGDLHLAVGEHAELDAAPGASCRRPTRRPRRA